MIHESSRMGIEISGDSCGFVDSILIGVSKPVAPAGFPVQAAADVLYFAIESNRPGSFGRFDLVSRGAAPIMAASPGNATDRKSCC